MNYYPYNASSYSLLGVVSNDGELSIDEALPTTVRSWSTTVHTFKQPHTITRGSGTVKARSEFYIEKELYEENVFIPVRGSRRKGYNVCDYKDANCVLEYSFTATGRPRLVYKHHLGTMPNGDKCFRDLDGYLCILKKDGILIEYAFNRNNQKLPYGGPIEYGGIYAG